MRSILDPLPLSSLRSPFTTVFRQLQRGKEFEKMAYFDGHYLLSGDGTGFYSSEKVSSPYFLAVCLIGIFTILGRENEVSRQ